MCLCVHVIHVSPHDIVPAREPPFVRSQKCLGDEIAVNRFDQLFVGSGSFVAVYNADGSKVHAQRFMAVSGFVVLCERIKERVHVLNDEGKRFTSLHVPGCGHAVLHPNGTIFVSDVRAHRILNFAVSGKLLGKFGRAGNGNGEFSTPNGLAVCDNGFIWVADSQNNRVQVSHTCVFCCFAKLTYFFCTEGVDSGWLVCAADWWQGTRRGSVSSSYIAGV